MAIAKPITIAISGALSLIYPWSVAHAGNPTTPTGTQIKIDVSGELLSVQVENVALGDVLQRIARQGGFPIDMPQPPNKTISATFNDVPLELGLLKLLETCSAVVVYKSEPELGSVAIEKLYVLSPSPVRVANGAVVKNNANKVFEAELSQADILFNKDMSVAERYSAMRRWMNRPDETTIPEVARLLAETEDSGLRRMAMVGLERTKGPLAIAALSDALSHNDDEVVRIRAVRSLGRKLGIEALPDLASVALEDSSAAVRRVAVVTLARFDTKATMEILQLAQSDPDEFVRRAARAALTRAALTGRDRM